MQIIPCIPMPDSLSDDLITMRLVRVEDFEALYEAASDQLIWEQHPAKDRYKSDVFRSYFDVALASGSAFVVRDTKTGTVIGCTRFYDYQPEQHAIALGYTFLARTHWGGEYNGAMKRLLTDYAFQFVEKIIFHVGAENQRSQKALLKLGAIETATMEMTINGQSIPHKEFTLTKPSP